MRKRHIGAIAAASTVIAASAAHADRIQARSMIVSEHGIAATEHPLASHAATWIMANGGNAIDAAVAANAMMGLVFPAMNGIGGDLFAIVYEAETGQYHGLQSHGWAPAGLSVEFLENEGFTEMPQDGIHVVTVPGAVNGWEALLSRFGNKEFADVLAPAIRYAREGFPITEWVADNWVANADKLRADPEASKFYLIDDRAPDVGDVFRNPDLAWSLEQIAEGGADAFYEGAIAERILRTSDAHGGTMTAADLAELEPRWVDPLSTTYRDWTVYQLPPSQQGIANLIMLNILESQPVGQWGHNTARALHTAIEAKKLAYADLYQYVADPTFADVPVAGLLDKQYARERGAQIDMTSANCEVDPGSPTSNTTYLTVVDKDGNMVSLIQSLFASFGSGIGVENSGFVLQNRGRAWTLDRDHPNVLEPRKRPFHTIIPAFMEKGDTRIAFGIMGGSNQPQAHAQFVMNVADYGMNIQGALEAARFRHDEGCSVLIEARVPQEVRDELTRLGHELSVHHEFSPSFGGGQAVMRDFDAGINYGASDPRKDGAAMAEFLPEAASTEAAQAQTQP